jgi:hypothetical protein
MKHKACETVVVTAAMSVALTLAMFWPTNLAATSSQGPPMPSPEIAVPTLKAMGCDLTLRPASSLYAPGETPELELRAVNTTDIPVQFEATVKMTVRDRLSELSRSLPVPREAWIESCPVSLAPHQTKVVRFSTGAKVAPGQIISFELQCGKETIVAARLAVPGIQAPQPASANPKGSAAAGAPK